MRWIRNSDSKAFELEEGFSPEYYFRCWSVTVQIVTTISEDNLNSNLARRTGEANDINQYHLLNHDLIKERSIESDKSYNPRSNKMEINYDKDNMSDILM